MLNKLADLVERDADKIAAIEARDAGAVQRAFSNIDHDANTYPIGKFFPHARHMDLVNVINTLRYYAGWADKSTGETLEVRTRSVLISSNSNDALFHQTNDAKFAYTRHEPIGVVVSANSCGYGLITESDVLTGCNCTMELPE